MTQSPLELEVSQETTGQADVVWTEDGRIHFTLVRQFDGLPEMLESGILMFVGASEDGLCLTFQADPKRSFTDDPYNPQVGAFNRAQAVNQILRGLWQRGYVDHNTWQPPAAQ